MSNCSFLLEYNFPFFLVLFLAKEFVSFGLENDRIKREWKTSPYVIEAEAKFSELREKSKSQYVILDVIWSLA